MVKDFPIYLLRGDMTAEPRVIHHVARFIAYQSGLGGVTKFIEDKTSEKRLSGHIFIDLRFGFVALSAD